MKTVRDFDFKGKRVLVRMDLDLPFEDGGIADDFRIRKALPTLKHICGQCSQMIIIGHRGRPEGADPELSLKPVAKRLSEIMKDDLTFVADCMVDELPDNKIVVLENLRYYDEEQDNDKEFAEKLAQYADIYVNESFAVSHREHASIVGIPKHLHGCIGLQFEQELKHLDVEGAENPVTAILGGAKLKTKMPVIKEFVKKVDNILLGGAMMFTFYKAKGWETGKSMVDDDFVMESKNLMNSDKLILPEDVVVADSTDSTSGEEVDADSMPEDKIGLDIGSKTIEKFKDILKKAKTIIWNGPLGYEENDYFQKGTNEIARFISELNNVKTIIGGGDTAEVIHELGLADKYTHVSTGGGASLMLMEGKKLPAVEALEE